MHDLLAVIVFLKDDLNAKTRQKFTPAPEKQYICLASASSCYMKEVMVNLLFEKVNPQPNNVS